MFLYVAFLLVSIITSNDSVSRTVDDLPVLEYQGCKNCERIYVPVCGTDGKTYVNPCKINCQNSKRKRDFVYIDRFGPCETVPRNRLNYSLWLTTFWLFY